MTGWMWLLATVIGVAILGAAIYYGRRQARSYDRNPGAVRESERATKQLYKEEERTRRKP
jgi:hypothetical protein